MQHVVHDGLVERFHVQVQDRHQAAVQRGEQRRGPDRLLRAGHQAAAERVVRLQRRQAAGRADIRAARQRGILHTADRQPGRHTAGPGPRAHRNPVVGHRAPDIDFGQLSGDQPVREDVDLGPYIYMMYNDVCKSSVTITVNSCPESIGIYRDPSSPVLGL